MSEQITTAELREAIRELEDAERRSQKAMGRRASMGPGASHSRKGAWTTANARWQSAAEYRDRCRERVEVLMGRALSNGLEISTKVMRSTGTNG